MSDADELNEQLAAIGVTWADVTETDPERSEPPTPAECQLVREFLAIKDKAYAEAAKQDDEWPTNATRAQRASEVLDFRRRQGLGETEDDSTTLQDILSDVRHLCDERGLDYAIIDKAAYRNYAAEVAESLTAGERAAVDAEVSEQLTQAVREATQHADESR